MKELNRVQVGDFIIENTVSIEQIKSNINNDTFWKEHLNSIEKIFENCNEVTLNNRKLELFLNGVKLTQNFVDGVYRIYNENRFIGIGVIKNNLLKRDIVII